MYLTGFADEAAQDLAGQIKATRELGWNAIESRGIDGSNIHDISDAAFARACEQLDQSGVRINCFGSTIANWGKRIEDPFEITLEAVSRALPRMQRLGTRLIRIMSYAPRNAADQMTGERFRRLTEISRRFLDAGITPVHENCMNFGGMSWQHSLQLIEAVPGLKLVYDTGNPVITRDWSTGGTDYQDPWVFYRNIKDHIAYVHIKDVVRRDGRDVYTYPNEGDGRIGDVLADLKASGYDGGISIEPHMASVFHDPDAGRADAQESYATYITYGHRLMAMLDEIGWAWQRFA
ncbi:MAG: sugar phosphate isomerase/epimerase [Rhodospirillales bacterium]|nr:sugar phosphate isomerase/epimerase [Rhodospirillales bacterium]